MGLQKYRADEPGPKQLNGAMPWYCNWIGGPTLALIRNCPIFSGAKPMPDGMCEIELISPRTVYVRGEPDTYFSVPAACTYKRKIVRGYITTDDAGNYIFRAYASGTVPKGNKRPMLRKYSELGHVHRCEPCAEYPGTYYIYYNGKETDSFSGNVGQSESIQRFHRIANEDPRVGKFSLAWECSDNDPRVGQVWFTGYYRLTEREI